MAWKLDEEVANYSYMQYKICKRRFEAVSFLCIAVGFGNV